MSEFRNISSVQLLYENPGGRGVRCNTVAGKEM